MSRFITWGLNKCCPSNTCLFATVVGAFVVAVKKTTIYFTMLVAIIPGWKLNRLKSKLGCFFEQAAKLPFDRTFG